MWYRPFSPPSGGFQPTKLQIVASVFPNGVRRSRLLVSVALAEEKIKSATSSSLLRASPTCRGLQIPFGSPYSALSYSVAGIVERQRRYLVAVGKALRIAGTSLLLFRRAHVTLRKS
jgi:hypothetical protein